MTGSYDPTLEDAYVEAVIREAALWAAESSIRHPFKDLEADTLYFGGGTPSLLFSKNLARIKHACEQRFRMSTQAEITLEINPATVGISQLHYLRQIGFNRASLGIQSLNNEDLKRMGRLHSADEAIATFEDLRVSGFTNISIDLLAGYPGQALTTFIESLKQSLELKPEHISVYLLEIKKGTKLEIDIVKGTAPPMDDDLAADMYEELCRITQRYGYEHYEISNFALPGYRSRHNLKYWRDVPFLGIGSAAHGMTGRIRYSHYENINSYISAITTGELPFSTFSHMTPEERFKDTLIMGLRLVEGIDLEELGKRYITDAYLFVTRTIDDLIEYGLCSIDDNLLRLTHRGRLLSNEVFARWV